MEIYSEYYDQSFNTTEIGKALGLYLQYCKEKKLTPEVHNLDMIDEDNIDHVLYHAEMQGFVIKDVDEEEL